MPLCTKCKIWFYSKECSFCLKIEEDKKEKKCERCKKVTARYYKGKMCNTCTVEVKLNKKEKKEPRLMCGKCNKTIFSGRLCKDCLDEKIESQKLIDKIGRAFPIKVKE